MYLIKPFSALYKMITAEDKIDETRSEESCSSKPESQELVHRERWSPWCLRSIGLMKTDNGSIPNGPNVHIPARTRFFNIPHLLEISLLHLPRLQLILIQRVNKSFQRTIEESVYLQRRLFFQINPHVRKVYAGVDAINPFLIKIGPGSRTPDNVRAERIIYRENLQDLANGSTWRITLLKDCDPNVSWKKMLVTMPPVKKLYLTKGFPNGIARFSNPHLHEPFPQIIERGSGFRMADVADIARCCGDDSMAWWTLGLDFDLKSLWDKCEFQFNISLS